MLLSEPIVNRIIEQNSKLDESGSILSNSQLEKYYQLFRQKFGPEVLSSLDGETLLNTMHDSSNHDSLVYWLEFKNDEELPNRFGGIGGGSALKFGVYRRGETKNWVTGSPQKQEQISVEQAITIARKHREQLLAGVKLLESLPLNAGNDDYAKLQKQMDEIAPDVSNTAWGHKYFSMLFPEKLEDYHNANFQRFHLIKLLQMPVFMEGRYSVTGQYMAISRELGMHINNLTRILNVYDGTPYRYWAIKANLSGNASANWKHWEEMKDGGFIGIGWKLLGDLSGITYDRESRTKIKTLMLEKYNEKGGFAQEIFNFVTVIKKGDLVIATEKQGHNLGIGRVTSGYYYEGQSDVSNRLKVEWLSTDPWETPIDEIKHRVVRELSEPKNQIDAETRIFGLLPIISQPMKQEVFQQVFEGITGRISDILERKKQVILYGPPGTGKTYWAYQAITNIAARKAFHTDFRNLNNEQIESIIGNNQAAGNVRFCTFHPSYGYEDFMEGYRPKSVLGTLVFELRSGIFKQLCQDAKTQKDQDFFLIIDEINRGDIPRIFGELLTILEKDKRGKTIFLPVSGESFSVPENVYVIGTMNTADRSIALLDTALRRRFGFIELMPDSTILGNTVVNGIPLGPWLDALNNRIIQSIGRDSRNRQIGHAYLLEKDHPITDFSKFARVLQEEIIPLLEEYCYEDYESLEKVLGKGLVDKEKQRIRHELFDSQYYEDLAQALLEPSPELTTTLVVVQQEQEILEGEDTEEQS